jgi:hypothetical protein
LKVNNIIKIIERIGLLKDLTLLNSDYIEEIIDFELDI